MRLGSSPPRPDALAKATGTYCYAGDPTVAGMLHGATLRCPHASARLAGLDVAAARAAPGVLAVVTADDVPGHPTYGLDEADQPVFVPRGGVARFHGEPVAAVAAETPAAARAALDLIVATWERLPACTDPEEALAGRQVHDHAAVVRHLVVECGDPDTEGEVAVEGTYEVRQQDQTFLAPEAGLAMPDADGGVTLAVATQWLHSDRRQVASCLGLSLEQVRVTLAGVGGAFGGREDVTLHVHACLLALLTRRPVRMVWSRADSFLGHPHRHPARMHYRHTADRDGRLVSVRARIVLDGGPYASSTFSVVGNAATMGAGPYVVPHASIEAVAVRTNNPPAGAMRGFGVVQTCAAHEAQMDALAAAVGLDPYELRRRNVLAEGDRLPTGQVVDGPAPVGELLDRLSAIPLPPPFDPAAGPLLPGGMGGCADPARVRRGVGIALGLKNIAFSEGYDDSSTASVRLELSAAGEPRAVVHSACAEVGQGFVTLAQQIARTELGVTEVVLRQPDTSIASAGSSSASRQTWLSGGAVQAACEAVALSIVQHVARGAGVSPAACRLVDGEVVSAVDTGARLRVPLAQVLADGAFDAERTFSHRTTTALDGRGQGEPHVAWAFVAHRAVVDVDVDLGTVRLVQLATVQDVGRVLNPVQLLGQLEGGAAQGVGLALMEELVLDGGRLVDPSLETYKLPTMLDLPDLVAETVELPHPEAPYGAKGIGEPPTVTSPAAVLAALRDATGLPLRRLPVRPEDLVAGQAADQA